jgi:uncharacterized CHY-type Zn-finger protein
VSYSSDSDSYISKDSIISSIEDSIILSSCDSDSTKSSESDETDDTFISNISLNSNNELLSKIDIYIDKNDSNINTFANIFKKKLMTISCKHYDCDCKIVAPCCEKIYDCWRCHNELEDHEIKYDKRYDIKKIICNKCNTKQPINNICINKECNNIFGKYYCKKCVLFDDKKNGFHCNKCETCIIGNKDDYVHCDNCGYCIRKEDNHVCIEKMSEKNCPICMDNLKYITDIIIFNCGHGMHKLCYNEYLKSSFKCPECMVTIKNMAYEWKKKDENILMTPLSSELSCNTIIHCNDCKKNCRTKFHYEGLKCTKCGSYNTYKK